jgi:hypothetical protein
MSARRMLRGLVMALALLPLGCAPQSHDTAQSSFTRRPAAPSPPCRPCAREGGTRGRLASNWLPPSAAPRW